MIPEAVHAVTSISPKKTQRFQNHFGLFQYYHIQKKCYGDYVSIKDEFGNPFFIATPERELVDFLYFRTRGLRKFDQSIFSESFRLQNLQMIDQDKLRETTGVFSQKKLLGLVELLIQSRG